MAAGAIQPRAAVNIANAMCNCEKTGMHFLGANMSDTRIIGTIAFSGELDPDLSSAAIALRKAGFEVTMMPEEFQSRLVHPERLFHGSVNRQYLRRQNRGRDPG